MSRSRRRGPAADTRSVNTSRLSVRTEVSPVQTVAQTLTGMCSDHELEILNLYCRTCDQLVCTDCVLQKHKLHDWCKVKDIADDKRADLYSNTQKVLEKTLPKFEQTLQDVQQISRENQKKKKETLQKIEDQSTAILACVRRIEQKLKEAVEQSFQSCLEGERDIREDFRNLSGLSKECEMVSQKGSDTDAIMVNSKLEKYIRQVTDLHSDSFKCDSSFEPGTIDNEEIEKMFGRVNVVSRPGRSNYVPQIVVGERKLLSKTTLNEDITSICSLGNQIWLHPRGSTENVVLDHEGNFATVKNFGVVVSHAFAKSLDGFLLCVDHVGKAILKLSGEGKFSKVVNTAPMKPLSICMTREGQYLACLEDSPSNGHAKTSQSRVFRLSVSGRIVQSIGTRLFKSPKKVLENTNSDICVIDKPQDQSSLLSVVSSAGVSMFKYTALSPSDVCCDQYSNIILISHRRPDVQILDHKGALLQTVLAVDIDNTFSALCVTIDNDAIWVAGTNGNVARIEVVYN